MQYLLETTDAPFTAADIRADLGLRSTEFDGVIEGMIASECARRKGCKGEVWNVQRMEGMSASAFAAKLRAIGPRIVEIGPGEEPNPQFYRLGGKVHTVRFDPDPSAVAMARITVAVMAANTLPIYEALKAQRWEDEQAVEAASGREAA